MRVLPVTLDEETIESLDAECELYGFESRSTYLQWIIDHREAIDQDLDTARPTLEQRLTRLETRLDELVRAVDQPESEPASSSTEQPTDSDDHPRSTTQSQRPDDRSRRQPLTTTDDQPTETGDRDRSTSTTTDAQHTETGNREPSASTTKSSETPEKDGSANADESATSPASETDGQGWRRSSSQPSVRLRGSPQTQVSQPRDRAASRSDDDATDESDTADRDQTTSTDDEGGLSMHLTPERVARIPDPDVEEDAGVLGNVEMNRLDELSRRAVAETRKQLDREVETGLNYTSSTGLAGGGVLPGEDIVDLESIEVPGRNADTIRKRRRLAGRAVAYLRDKGTAKKGDFVDALYDECPAEYGSSDGWWRCVKATLKQIDVVEGGDGSRIWRYVG